MNFNRLFSLAAVALMFGSVQSADAQKHSKFKIGKHKFKIVSVSGERSFAYSSPSASGLVSSGTQEWQMESEESSKEFGGVNIKLSGPIAHDLKISDELAEIESCYHLLEDASVFGTSVDLHFNKRGRVYDVSANWSIDPTVPGFAEALESLCPGAASGIRGSLLRVMQTGNSVAECDGSETCAEIPVKQINKSKKVEFLISHADLVERFDESSVLVTNLKVVVKKVKKNNKKKNKKSRIK